MSPDELDLCQPPAPPRTKVPLKIEEALAGGAIGLLAVITFLNVLVRYLTNFSFAFTEEFSIALMVIMALLGTASAVAKNGHIRIAYFVERLGSGLKRRVEAAGAAVVALAFALLVFLGARMTWDEYRFEVTSPGLGYPQWLYTLWLPILAAAISLRAIGLAIRLARGGNDK